MSSGLGMRLYILIGLSLVFESNNMSAIESAGYKNIIERYTLVGDLSKKEEKRELKSEHVFWRYPISLSKPVFPYTYMPRDRDHLEEMLPAVEGSTRAAEHLNRGRVLFFDGNINRAGRNWLGARARFGRENPDHRRTDYMIAIAFLHAADAVDDPLRKKNNLNHAATFLSWAYQMKGDIADPIVDRFKPLFQYNLAAIYFNHERYGGAFGLAREALDWLRRYGKGDHRPELRRILAESFIKNRSYLEAVTELDIALREQQISRESAAAVFYRIGDIYFDLNNFELAEDVYNLGHMIDRERGFISPTQYALRGESLFWMGRFSEANRMFYYALNAAGTRVGDIGNQLAAVASIRTADSWLAQVRSDKIQKARLELDALKKKKKKTQRGSKARSQIDIEIEKSKNRLELAEKPLRKAVLGYYRHTRSFPNDHTSDHARVRLACLNLPEYMGENIKHARSELNSIRKGISLYHMEKSKPVNLEPTENEDDKEESNAEEKKAEELAKNAKMVTDPGIPPEVLHLAWGCEIKSYAQHDRNEELLDRVKDFAKSHSESDVINDLIEPVRETQALKLNEYFAAEDKYGVYAYFTKHRDLLFPKISKRLAIQLFPVYIDVFKSQEAEEFAADFASRRLGAYDRLRYAVFASETAGSAGEGGHEFQRNEEFGEQLTEKPPLLNSDNNALKFIDRVLNSGAEKPHILWILSVAERWSEDNSKMVCKYVLPLLMRIGEDPRRFKTTHADLKDRTLAHIDKFLPELLQFETFCGYSLMEFEKKILADDPIQLSKRMTSREDFVPVNEFTARLYWSIAESLYENKHTDEATRIWQRLSESGLSNVPEVSYARLRLEKRRTELEDLWQ